MTALGMVMGMLLTRLCTGSHLAAWLSFAVLTLLHVWANLRAMRCLVLTSVNQPRLDALLQAYDTNVSNRRAWRCGVPACSPGHLCRPQSVRQPPHQQSCSPILIPHFASSIVQGRVLTPAEMSFAEDLTPPPFKRLLTLLRAAAGPLLGSAARGGSVPSPHRPGIHLGVSLSRAVAAYRGGTGGSGGTASQMVVTLRKLLKDQGNKR